MGNMMGDNSNIEWHHSMQQKWRVNDWYYSDDIVIINDVKIVLMEKLIFEKWL
jgi:hypothetical protein